MLPALPSLTFQPRFYTGREARFYLPLLYDLIALRKPRRIVTLGFGDAQVHFTICQAVREQRVEGQVLTVRRAVSGEKSEDDAEWQQAKADSDEFYQEIATLVSGAQTERAAESDLADVDFLFLDGSDSSEKIAAELRAWQPRLAPDALVLMHGLALERAGHSPRLAWEEFAKGKATAEFPDGLGLGLTALSPPAEGEDLLARIFSREESRAELDLLYRSVIARIDFQARAVEAERANASLKLRQVWLDTLLADRGHAQEVMDYHAREIETQTRELETRAHALESRDRDLANLQEHIAKLNAQIVHRQTQLVGLGAHLALSQEALEEKGAAFATLHQDRVKAQLIMDAQSEQLKHWIDANEAVAVEKEKLKAKVAEQKRLIQAAKGACRRRGRCFQLPSAEPKQQRTIAEKIVRELRRIPASLTPAPAPPPPPRALAPPKTETTVRAAEAPDRYTDWIAQHEPDAAGLDLQRKTAAEMTGGPKLSLLLPTYDTPEPFLVALAASLAAQTYTNFEVCVADGGSNSETVALLRQWQENEPRLQIEFLRTNLAAVIPAMKVDALSPD
ncbi:MAG: class I SAM-dependent methyltransferase, partial [Chthoniobacterales bacterium]